MAHATISDVDLALFELMVSPSTPDGLFESALQARLKDGASLDARDEDQRDALMLAAWSGQPAWRLRRLVELGARVDSVDREGNSALHLAGRAGSPAGVMELTRLGADPNALNLAGRRPMHLAAESGSPRSIVELGRAGAAPDALDGEGFTPMALALRRRAAANIGALLSLGLSPDVVPEGQTQSLAEWVRDEGCGDRVAATCGARAREALRERGVDIVRGRDGHGRSGLHEAALHGDLEAARHFLDAGARPDLPDGRGETPLSMAAASSAPGAADCIRELARRGAGGPDGGAEGSAIANALMTATRLGLTENIRALVARGADVNARVGGERGETPAEVAAALGRLASLQTLHELGASLGGGGITGGPLVNAVISGGPDTVRWLLDNGAPVGARGEKGRDALSWAASFANERDGLETLRALLAAGASVKARDAQGKNALHAAAMAGQRDACEILIASGADVGDFDQLGRSALWLAAERGDTGPIETLLRANADPRQADSSGREPLHVAVSAGGPGATRLLLAAGASPVARDQAGWSAIHYATASARPWARGALFALCADKQPLGESDPEIACPSPLLLALQSTGQGVSGPVLRQPMGAQAARALLAIGERATATNSAGETGMHLAAASGDAESIRELAAAGGDVNARDKRGQTPLAMAAAAGSAAAARALVELGADLSMTPTAGYDAGKTPLQIARSAVETAEGAVEQQEAKLALALIEGASAHARAEATRAPRHAAQAVGGGGGGGGGSQAGAAEEAGGGGGGAKRAPRQGGPSQ